MAHFFDISQRKTIQLLLFIVLFKITLQQGPLKEPKELVGHANSLLNQLKQGNFGANSAIEWMQKNAIGILCNGKFELKMDENLKKLQNEFCKSFENQNFQNLMELLQTTKIEKKTFDQSQMDKAIANDQMLNVNNKGMFKRLLNNYNKIVEIHENLIEAKKFAVLQQKPNGFMGRRKKRAGGCAILGCIAAVVLTLISAPPLAYFGNIYAHVGDVQFEVTHCQGTFGTFFCYNDIYSLHNLIIKWSLLFAVGFILALVFCIRACKS